MIIILNYEKTEKYNISEIFDKLDYTNPNPLLMIDKSFEEVQKEKAKKYINEVKSILDKYKLKYSYEIEKILPKYLKEGIGEINFKVVFTFKIEKNTKNKNPKSLSSIGLKELEKTNPKLVFFNK